MEKNVIFCIDFKSFYASCECIDRGLNPHSTKLVVADKERGSGTIVLAVSPYLKTFGVPSRLRVFELPKDEEIIFAKPRMSRYLEISAKAISIFLDYINKDDLHVYSVDESFLNITPYLHLYKKNPIELAEDIKQRIYKELGLDVTIGIGPNLFLAKVALDNEAKKNSNQIAYWTKEDIKTKLHNIKPLSKIWSIGSQMEKKLNSMGIYSLKDVNLDGIEIVEDGKTFEHNALIKARTIAKKTKMIAISDDSGLEVDAIGKKPGIYSARFAGENATDEENRQKLLKSLKNIPMSQRGARFVSAIAVVFPDGKEFVVRGTCEGNIGFEEKGKNGFGYDSLFFYPEFNKTFAELSSEEKNEVSHRANAVKKLKEYLETIIN